MNFIHASDFHLGYFQYGLMERFRDYARAFHSVITYAIDHKVKFILISGDLFHKRNINAPTYLQAYKVLSELKEKSPETCVYAIEGNHDLAFHQDGKSWLEILDSQGLLKLIRISEKNGLSLMGDFVELEDVRIFGMRYLGSNTISTLPLIAQEIRKIKEKNGKKYTILMMHFGMEDQTNHENAGEIPFNSLLPLKEDVNYLALGHYHNQYEIDGWVFNPGSVEMVSMHEYGYPKGFYHVNNKGAELISPITRPVRRLKMDTSNIMTPQELYSNIQARIEREPGNLSGRCPIVELLLYGELNFPKSDISIERIREIIDQHFKPLFSEIKIIRTNSQYVLSGGDIRGRTREEIELRVFSDRIKLDGRYREKEPEILSAMVEVKKMACAGIEESAIRKELRWCFEKMKMG